MTLEEAINLYERQAEELYKAIPCDGCAFNMCKKEHRQLAEWLRELKGYREARQELEERHAVGTLDLIDRYIEEAKADEESE